tara:strand:+ start:1079 stop:1456 length:378 start_codon:yes stop_codon:yes gene_type:complete
MQFNDINHSSKDSGLVIIGYIIPVLIECEVFFEGRIRVESFVPYPVESYVPSFDAFDKWYRGFGFFIVSATGRSEFIDYGISDFLYLSIGEFGLFIYDLPDFFEYSVSDNASMEDISGVRSLLSP